MRRLVAAFIFAALVFVALLFVTLISFAAVFDVRVSAAVFFCVPGSDGIREKSGECGADSVLLYGSLSVSC